VSVEREVFPALVRERSLFAVDGETYWIDTGTPETSLPISCPADAVADVRAVCQFISSKPGGRGAARELIELVLKLRGLWPNALAAVKGPPGS
jgi:3-deoxy-D-manno-octulosonate 8-phosphate phosphatase KdsC-like HAD superfamily phosphatase